jgi:hypothetical protein
MKLSELVELLNSAQDIKSLESAFEIFEKEISAAKDDLFSAYQGFGAAVERYRRLVLEKTENAINGN